MSKRSDLPDGLPKNWRWASFGDVAEYVNGYGFSKSEWEDEGRPIIRIQNLTGTGDSFNYYSGEIDEKYVVTPGTLLISWSATLGAYIWRGEEALLNQHIYKVKPHDHVSKKYLYYVADFSDDELMRRAHGSGMKHVTKDVFENFPIPLPPLPEQRRIVAKIEELFSNLDAGMDDLQAAGQQLERYRLSVLQAAVEGRLTADWRRTHDPEPADQLLERITQERRQFWESWYRWEKYESKGKEPPSGWKSRFKTYDQPDAADLSDIPSTWEWVQVQQVGQVQLGRQRAPEYHEGENMVPYLRVANVFEERIDTSDVKEMHFSERAYQKYKLEEGDILLNEGQSLELVGRPAMYRGTPPGCCFQNTLIRFRGYGSLNRQYALLIFRGYMHTGRFADVASQTTSVAHLGSRRFSKMPFPLPPLAEQRKIVQEAERLLSVADDAAATTERQHTRAERLRQSILKQAFSGRLVPHDEEAAPPSMDGTASKHSDSDTNDGSESDVADLLGSADPSKQIEMDL